MRETISETGHLMKKICECSRTKTLDYGEYKRRASTQNTCRNSQIHPINDRHFKQRCLALMKTQACIMLSAEFLIFLANNCYENVNVFFRTQTDSTFKLLSYYNV